MDTIELKKHLQEKSLNAAEEFQRLFHGRGGLYEGLRHLTIDSIGSILSVALYFEESNEQELIAMLQEFTQNSNKYTTLVIQRRYIKGAPSETLLGEVPQDLYILENGMKIKLNLLSNKNSGYFPDMSKGALKRKGPYDLIIIDPPSFQRGSFEATKDYEKIIKKLPALASEKCTLLACLNSPELESSFIINMTEEHAPSFKFIKRLENLPEFANADETKSLKNLIFQRD